jgi:phage baseplate assembly protein W
MAITIDSLNGNNTGLTKQPSKDNTSNSTFVDLGLDFDMETTGGKSTSTTKSGKLDLKLDEDYKAISNSIVNIFNTSPGQKILNPSFGADLSRYLFSPITPETGQVIGNVILKALEMYEPRVNIDNIDIVADIDRQQYTINIYVKIISLENKDFKFKGTLSQSGLVQTIE